MTDEIKLKPKTELKSPEAISSKRDCLELFLLYQRNAEDVRCNWQGLGDKAVFYEQYLMAARCYTQHLQKLLCCEYSKFKKSVHYDKKTQREQVVFNGKPFAETRYRLAKAFLKAGFPGLAFCELGFAEQYIGDEELMCTVLEKLEWWQALKGRYSALLGRAKRQGDDVSADHYWQLSDDISEKLNSLGKHEGESVPVDIHNIQRPGGEFKHLEVQPVIFAIPGSVSQLPHNIKPLLDRLNSVFKTFRASDLGNNKAVLCALQDFQKGDLIFSETASLCFPIAPTYCTNCLKQFTLTEARFCMECCEANPPSELFCSMECLKQANETYHKHLCGAPIHKLFASARKSPQSLGYYAILVLKAMCKATQHPDWPRVGVLDLPEFKYLTHGPSHNVHFPTFYALYNLVARLSATYGIPTFNLDTFQLLFSKISNHAMKFQNNGKSIGIVLGDATCYLPHDCSPNVGVRVRGNVLEVHALKPIKSGETLTKSFIAIATPKQARKVALLQFGVSCSCKRCA